MILAEAYKLQQTKDTAHLIDKQELHEWALLTYCLYTINNDARGTSNFFLNVLQNDVSSFKHTPPKKKTRFLFFFGLFLLMWHQLHKLPCQIISPL